MMKKSLFKVCILSLSLAVSMLASCTTTTQVQPIAFSELKNKADKGDKDAQYRYAIAVMSKNSGDVSVHDPKVFLQQYNELMTQVLPYVEQSAQQEHYQAQMLLGMYHVSKDEKLGIEWITKSAQQGYAQAQIFLGSWYLQESKDTRQAQVWLEKASVQGYGNAKAMLAVIYLTDKDSTNDSLVKPLLAEATKQGEIEAGRMQLLNLRADMITSMATNIQKKAELGHADSQMAYAVLYYLGVIGKDENKAREWLTKSAEQGHAPAIYNLALYNQQGIAGQVDFDRAESLFQQACKGGIKRACDEYEKLHLISSIDFEK